MATGYTAEGSLLNGVCTSPRGEKCIFCIDSKVQGLPLPKEARNPGGVSHSIRSPAAYARPVAGLRKVL